jgi:cell division protein FtsN
MAKTDGEYELVLGNRQLLSAFFIVVILFALFFTMGYIVGRNSAPTTMASTAVPVQSAASGRASAPPSSTSPPKETASETPKPTETASDDDKAPAPTTRSVATPPEPPASRETPSPVEPRAGSTFLQVAAVGQPQAGAVVETLKAKGFPARLAPGPNNTVFRVLVGPYGDAATLGKAKADLENAGFHPIMRK